MASSMKAQWEAKIKAEARSDDIKSKEFSARTGGVSNKRGEVQGFAAKPSSVKANWESKIDYETKADADKAKDFTQDHQWSKKRAEDVPGFGVKPSSARAGVEARVKYESQTQDVKAQDFVKKSDYVKDKRGEELQNRAAAKILAGPDSVMEDVEARVKYESATADAKARQFLEETTYLGVARRPFKSTLIPLSVLFAKPHKDHVRISPNKKYLAWRCHGRSMGDPFEVDNGVMNLFVKRLEDNKIRQITFSKVMDACNYFTFTPDEKSIVFLREKARGSETYSLYALEIGPFFDQDDEKSEDPKVAPPAYSRPLIKDPTITCGVGFVGGIQMWTNSEEPRQVYVSTAQIGPKALFWDVSKVDIDADKVVLVVKNPMSTSWGAFKVMFLTFLARILSYCCIKLNPPGVPIQWFPDEELNFRGRIEVNLLNLGVSFKARPMKGKKWKTLHSCSFEDSNTQLVGSTGGSGTARMDFNGDEVDMHLCAYKKDGKRSDTTTFERFDIWNGRHLKRVAGGDSTSDITGFVEHPNGRAQFFYYEREKKVLEIVPKAESFDHQRCSDDIKYIQSYFTAASARFEIVSRANADDTWIVYAENDRGHSMFKGSPGAYYLFTRSAKIERRQNQSSHEVGRNLELIFPSRPEMYQYKLARMDPVHVKARDGQDLLCYLSRPVGAEVKGREEEFGPPPPMVVLIHGGPQARDSWGYNPMCQFLCSRGFRVLQVNYRGSSGFGAKFLRIGMNGEFYKSLQHDISDAVEYATSDPGGDRKYFDAEMPPLPWGDPSQLAILGGSFGGYSALWQMTSNPDIYKCAVAISAISSVGAADKKSQESFGGSPLIQKYWRRVFGERISKLKIDAMKASPMYNLGKVSKEASIALYHGENDPRAPIDHCNHVLEGLKKNGIAGEVVTFAGEGHSISKEANKLYMYYRIEDFICKKLGMQVFDAGDDKKKIEDKTATVKWSAKRKENA